MDDLNFGKVWIKLSGFDPEKQVTTPTLKPIAAGFGANIMTVHRMMFFNPNIVGLSMRYKEAELRAIHEVTGHLDLSEDDRKDVVKMSEIEAIKTEIVRKCELAELLAPEKQHDFLRGGAQDFLSLLRLYPAFNASAKSVLVAMLITTWTAFEVMAADLWEGALNTNPRHLAGLHGVPREGKQDQQSAKLVELSLLHKFLGKENYNLGKVMGTLHRKSGRFKFTTLDGTRLAYKVTD